MKTRKQSGIVVAFGLMAMLARPQIMFAQALDNPIRGSWEGVKAVPPGDEVVARLRNGQTLKGRLTGVSDTVLTLARGKKTIDVNRGDALKVYRVIQKSGTKGDLIGLAIGTGVGVLLGAIAEASNPGQSESPGVIVILLGLIGAGAGVAIGGFIGSRRQRELIYETK